MQIEVGGTVVKYNSHTQREFMVFTELTEIGVKKEKFSHYAYKKYLNILRRKRDEENLIGGQRQEGSSAIKHEFTSLLIQ
jgi:hypothetical protein